MDALERYIHDLSSPEEDLLHELDRQTHLRVVQPRMLSGHIQGKLLELFVRMLRPRNILEIGTFTGYSALCMAAGLEEDGVLDTVEVDDELEEFAASFFRRSPHGRKNPSAYRFGTRYRPDTRIYVRPRIHRWRQARIPGLLPDANG